MCFTGHCDLLDAGEFRWVDFTREDACAFYRALLSPQLLHLGRGAEGTSAGGRNPPLPLWLREIAYDDNAR